MQVAQLVRQQHPGMEVVGTNYPVPFHKVAAAKAATGVQMGVIAVAVLGDKVFTFLGVPVPGWYTNNMAQNRMGWGMGAWIVGNLVSQNLQNTGAFEIYWNTELVFSKKKLGRMPQVEELLGNLHKAMRSAGYPIPGADTPHGLPQQGVPSGRPRGRHPQVQPGEGGGGDQQQQQAEAAEADV